ncbi:chloride channel protein [Asticcacaulis sp. EMRT-3]|uniref:chloride channel protein n=1 Tax=Asticcacaulis sp. EMRT-3 TaxID=3040349 RepID=UPI0024AF4644|nr:chloride channel protein [Asticcacaulis sp. EMRT-3]MDI7775994.1 chloride channel protein [Asticcacaulis sp. EMRT-3]
MPKDLRRLRPVISRWMSLRHWRSQLLFWSGGLLVGLVAVSMTMVADKAQALFFGMRHAFFWLPLIITPLGFAVSSYVTKRWFGGAQGSGIPQVIAASELVRHDPEGSQNLVSIRIIIGKVAMLMLGLVCGAPIGREGPTVQVGAALMRMTGRIGGIVSNESALLLAGGAAGVAAAFNTPLAGIVFAIEELGKSFEQRTSGTVILTVMLAGIASMGLLGDYTYFGRHTTGIIGWPDVVAVFVCGIGGGLLGGGFSRGVIFGLKRMGSLFGGFTARRPVVFAAMCGLLLAILGVATGGAAFGTGYSDARDLLAGTQHVWYGYGLLRVVSALLMAISGIPGGLFAPSLSAGAGVGADLHFFVPMVPLATMALLGMVGYFSGVVQSPLTAFVIVMEMTDDHDMVLPLIATSLLAYSVSRLVCPRPLYHSLAQSFLKKARDEKRAETAEVEAVDETGQIETSPPKA